MSEQLIANLTTCKNCGALMVKVTRDICPECYRKEELLFLKIKDFLKMNLGANITQVAQSCDCTEEEVFGFIKSGRLERIGLGRIAHPCELCNTTIYEGVMCEECKKKLKNQVNTLTIESIATSIKNNNTKK